MSLVPLLRQAHVASAHDSISLLVSFCSLHEHCFNRDLQSAQVLQHLCSLSLRPNLTSLMLACSGVSFATLTLALALPRLRCLALNTHAVRHPASIVECCMHADIPRA